MTDSSEASKDGREASDDSPDVGLLCSREMCAERLQRRAYTSPQAAPWRAIGAND